MAKPKSVGKHVHGKLPQIAEERRRFHQGNKDIPVAKLSELDDAKLQKLRDSVFEIKFDCPVSEIVEDVYADMPEFSEPHDMEADKSEGLPSVLEPVESRRAITSIIQFHISGKLHDKLILIDLFKGSTPAKETKEALEQQLQQFIQSKVKTMRAEGAKGLLLQDPDSKGYHFILFDMDFPGEQFAFKKFRTDYKEKFSFAHEDEQHRV